VGNDLVIVRFDGDGSSISSAVRHVEGVTGVEVRGHEAVVAATSGSSAVSGVIVGLRDAGVAVRELTLRTPTLDDVFLELTGNRLGADDQPDDSDGDDSNDTREHAA
jgi:ABC-2 type transport system ATP-binding protein